MFADSVTSMWLGSDGFKIWLACHFETVHFPKIRFLDDCLQLCFHAISVMFKLQIYALHSWQFATTVNMFGMAVRIFFSIDVTSGLAVYSRGDLPIMNDAGNSDVGSNFITVVIV